MSTYLQLAILGLAAGAIYSAIAQGVVLAYKGSGVVNLAHGAMAMYGAYVYAALRNSGTFAIPPLPNPLALIDGVDHLAGGHLSLPSIPTMINFGHSLGTIPAAVIALATAALLGYLVHLLVFRPLRSASPVAKTVASVGVTLTLEAIVSLRFGTDEVAVPSLLPSNTFKLFGAPIPVNRLILCGVALAIAAGLTVIFRYTYLGIATKAAADNEMGAMLSGLSPDRLAAANWILSSLIAAIVGILFSSLTGLDPTDYVLYIIPALGAALVARFQSYWIAAIAGLLIGVIQSMIPQLHTDFSWFPNTVGLEDGVPFILIIVAIVLLGKRIPQRGTLLGVRLPSSPQPRCALPIGVGVTLAVTIGLLFFPPALRGALMNSMSGTVLALSFVIILGMAGQISLMQVAIAGVGAILVIRFAGSLPGDLHIPFPFAQILAVVAAAVAGLVCGLPALRVRGIHLAILTLAAAAAFEALVLNNTSILRANDGSGALPPVSIFGLNLDINRHFPVGPAGIPGAWFGFFELIVVDVACFSVIRLRRGAMGRRLLALRSNERAALALGVDVARTKMYAFMYAGLLAGLAGVLSTYTFTGVSADQYSALLSISALAIAYLGGIATVGGAVYAGTLATGGLSFTLLETYVHLGDYQFLVAGVGLVITAVINPEGIVGVMNGLVLRLIRRARPRSGPDADLKPVRQQPAVPAALAGVES